MGATLVPREGGTMQDGRTHLLEQAQRCRQIAAGTLDKSLSDALNAAAGE
jgi:hypothetical protein